MCDINLKFAICHHHHVIITSSGIPLVHFGYFGKGVGRRWRRLFEAKRLLTFHIYRVNAYSSKYGMPDQYWIVCLVLTWTLVYGGLARNFVNTTLYNSVAYSPDVVPPRLENVPVQHLGQKIKQVSLNFFFLKYISVPVAHVCYFDLR